MEVKTALNQKFMEKILSIVEDYVDEAKIATEEQFIVLQKRVFGVDTKNLSMK